jgi:hypothetical protein
MRGSSPLICERFLGIDRRGGDFGLVPWQITDSRDAMPIEDGRAIGIRPPLQELQPIAGTRCQNSNDVMGPFQVGSLIIGLRDISSNVTLPTGFDQVWTFNAPGYVPGARFWSYLGHTVLGSTLCVLMRWSADQSIHLHVFDGKTGYATQVNGTGCPWTMLSAAKRGYTPRIGEAGGRLWITGPDNNVWFSAIGRPRIFWTKSADDISATGYEWVMPIDRTLASVVVTIPYLYAEVIDPDRWCGAVAERMVVGSRGDISWSPLEPANAGDTYYSIPAPTITWTAASAPSGGSIWTNVTIPFALITGIDDVVRVRIVPPRLGSGSIRRWVRSLDVADLFERRTETWVGDGATKVFKLRDPASFPFVAQYIEDQFLTKVDVTTTVGAGDTDKMETQSISINGVKTRCLVSIGFATAPASGKVVTLTWFRCWAVEGASGMYPSGFVSIEPNRLQLANGTVVTETHGAGRPHAYNVNGTVDYILQFPLGSQGTGHFPILVGGPRPISPEIVYMGKTIGTASLPQINRSSGATADLTWDESKWQEALDLAGDGRAGLLPTGQHAVGQTGIRVLMANRNRLLVIYESSMQLWLVDGAPSTMKLLDTAPMGAGSQLAQRGALMGNVGLFATDRGVTAVSLTGQSTDRITTYETMLGIFGRDPGLLGTPEVYDLVVWPELRAAVVLLIVPGESDPSVWVMFNDNDSKSLGWWRWSVPSASPGQISARVGGLAVRGRALYLHGAEDSLVRRYDADAILNDPFEPSGNAYEASVTWAYQHGGKPSALKRWTQGDMTCLGTVTLFGTPLGTRQQRTLLTRSGNSYERMPFGLMLVDTAWQFQVVLTVLDSKCRIDRLEVQAIPLAR